MIKNTIANFLGLFLSLLLNFIFAPIFLYYLGDDQYGLVGIFLLFQLIFTVLDVGLSPTLSRQISCISGMQKDFDEVLKLLKSFEVIFLVFASLTLLGFSLASDIIISFIHERSSLGKELVRECVTILGLLISVRWFFSLYRSGLIGFEDQVWLNITISVTNTLRHLFIFGLFLLNYIDVTLFFALQLSFVIADVFLLKKRLYSHFFIKTLPLPVIYFNSKVVKEILPFASSVALSAILWVSVNNLHKTVLSVELTLKEYGYFTIMTMLSGSIILIAQPVSQSLIPRLTMLKSKRADVELLNLYTQSSQFIAALSFSIMALFWFHAEQILMIWTQNAELAKWGAAPLRWFALGNCFLCLSGFPYFLQVATGKLNLHLLGQLLATCIQVPLIYFAITNYGITGAGVAWAIFRAIWFFLWVAFIHNRLSPGFHFSWLFQKILPVIFTIIIISGCYFLFTQPLEIIRPWQKICSYTVMFIVTFTITMLWIEGFRNFIHNKIKH